MFAKVCLNTGYDYIYKILYGAQPYNTYNIIIGEMANVTIIIIYHISVIKCDDEICTHLCLSACADIFLNNIRW